MAKRRFDICEIVTITTTGGNSFCGKVTTEADDFIVLTEMGDNRLKYHEITKRYITSVTRFSS